jgi:hypothetical protein
MQTFHQASPSKCRSLAGLCVEESLFEASHYAQRPILCTLGICSGDAFILDRCFGPCCVLHKACKRQLDILLEVLKIYNQSVLRQTHLVVI